MSLQNVYGWYCNAFSEYFHCDINDLEQYGRRQNLEIQGIPMSDNENNAETENKVLTVL